MASSPPKPTLGQIQVIFGPMFSGKSTELLRRIRRYTIAKRNCLVIKYKRDVRYDAEKFSTHDKIQWAALPCSDKLFDIKAKIDDYDVIGIDEGQFFTDIDSFSEHMANDGKIVIIAALDGTFQRKPFGNVLNLVPLAESVTKLSAVCMLCQDDAAFSLRLTKETAVEVIGGADKYIAVCRTCFTDASAGNIDQEKLQEILCQLSPTKSAQHTHQHRFHLPTDPNRTPGSSPEKKPHHDNLEPLDLNHKDSL